MMKKSFTILLTMILLVGCFGVNALAEETSADEVSVCVTIAVKGELVLVQETVPVTDADGDGALTIGDALACAHESSFEGGAAVGFASAQTEYGLSLTKLWGDESGAFGYYLNNASPMSLGDAVADGDFVNAFVYSDSTSWSDAYSHFDKANASAKEGKSIELKLSMAGYDENWNPISLPVVGATVTVNGVATDVATDENGAATIVIDESGEYVISAVSETTTLVPPVCVVTITADESSAPETTTETTPDAGDSSSAATLVVLSLVAFAGIIMMKKRAYAK